MIVSRLILKNWKNFKSVDIPLSARTFIMGPNGIGKSNLLDALRFLADIARPEGGLSFALQIRGGLEKIKFSAAKKKEAVELEVHRQTPFYPEPTIATLWASPPGRPDRLCWLMSAFGRVES